MVELKYSGVMTSFLVLDIHVGKVRTGIYYFKMENILWENYYYNICPNDSSDMLFGSIKNEIGFLKNVVFMCV